MQKKWFKRKLYGYGWYPASWEGWLCLLVFCAYIVWCLLFIQNHTDSVGKLLINFLPRLALAMAIITFLAIKKGERPRWQWGKKIED